MFVAYFKKNKLYQSHYYLKMKKLFFVVAVLVGAVSGHAQDRGYRGSIETGYTVGFGKDVVGGYEYNTVHGYKFNPYFYAGAGVGMDVQFKNFDTYCISFPVFADFRASLPKKVFSPFADLRVGRYIESDNGLYSNLSVGAKLKITDRQAFNFSVGYVLRQLSYTKEISTPNGYIFPEKREFLNGVNFRVAYEF